MTPSRALTIALRVLVAGLSGAIAGIHLDLWNNYGYRHIRTIGVLFVLNGVAGAMLALASLAIPRRILPLVWLAASGFAASTLAALIVSLNGTLFGFHETSSAPLLAASIILEAAAIVAGAAGALWQLKAPRP